MKESDLNANVRTLIVCFVVGVFSLIPLRFYEVSQTAGQISVEPMVLGVVEDPGQQVSQYEELFELPYREIDAPVVRAECVAADQVEALIDEANRSGYNQADVDALVEAISSLEVCE